jgi:hypothetical protein
VTAMQQALADIFRPRRHGRGALPCRKGAGACQELDRRRGAVRFLIEAGGALKEIIEAPSLDVVRVLDARTNIGYAVEPAAASEPDGPRSRAVCQAGDGR